MSLKQNVYGYTLIAVMALFVTAACLFTAGMIARRRGLRIAAEVCFLAGSAAACGLWVYRWTDVKHLPLQNMFEVFLTMAMLIWPISAFCRFALGARLAMLDALIGFLLAFPPAFVNKTAFSADPQNLPPALQTWIFGPHVLSYMIAYVVAFMAAFQAIAGLVMGLLNGTARNKFLPAELVEADRVAYRMACLGFPLLTLGLVLGSVWGKLAWGDYWNWDPKEMWSLASWFAYLGYFHFRAVFPGRWRWASSLLLIFAGAVVLLTLLTAILPKLSGGGGGMHAYGG